MLSYNKCFFLESLNPHYCVMGIYKRKIKQEFFQAVIMLHKLDLNKMLRENARWELHKNAMSYFEHI